jgi:hypothetical protein
MCTVSFTYKGNNEFILTSNRDEIPTRETQKPAVYLIDNTRLVFPKDVVGGGTWIGMSDQKRVVCLLNGGFTFHERLPAYRHSRGIVVNDFLKATNITRTVFEYNLEAIEPFTVIVIDWNESLQLFELVWDGSQKHFQKLPLDVPHIWSSSTLYSEEMKQLRRDWFETFQQKTKLDANSLYDFHTTGGIGDPNVDVIMDRVFIKTMSITQIEKNDAQLTMKYHDLTKATQDVIAFNPIEALHE